MSRYQCHDHHHLLHCHNLFMDILNALFRLPIFFRFSLNSRIDSAAQHRDPRHRGRNKAAEDETLQGPLNFLNEQHYMLSEMRNNNNKIPRRVVWLITSSFASRPIFRLADTPSFATVLLSNPTRLQHSMRPSNFTQPWHHHSGTRDPTLLSVSSNIQTTHCGDVHFQKLLSFSTCPLL